MASARGLLALCLVVGLGCGARTELPGFAVGGEGGADPGPTSSSSNAGGGGGVADGGGGAGGVAEGGGGVGGVEQLALGAGHSCLRTFEGDVYCWGFNNRGQLGLGDEQDRLVPERVDLGGPARNLAAGAFHTCAVRDGDGALLCWGDHGSGQVGVGLAANDEILSPTQVDLAGVVALALGEQHSCALAGNAAHCWGNNTSGQLGLGSFAGSHVPTPVMTATIGVSLAAGGFHSAMLGPDGAVRSWGANSRGECGVTPGADQPAPVVAIDGNDLGLLGLHAGMGRHTCARQATALLCWGDNTSGVLGRGFASTSELPGAVDLPAGAVGGVAAGFAHTCAIVDGDVHCWGENGAGKLGVGSGEASVPTPTRVPGLAGVVAIGAGTQHTCAYLGPSEVWCWGANAFGQLGTGDTQARDAPTRITLP